MHGTRMHGSLNPPAQTDEQQPLRSLCLLDPYSSVPILLLLPRPRIVQSRRLNARWQRALFPLSARLRTIMLVGERDVGASGRPC